MSKYTICNDVISVSAHSVGAEMCSIKSINPDREFVWQADPRFWGRHSCILFPYIGKMWENQLRIGDSIFSAKQHGFLRDQEFELISKKNNTLKFRNQWSPHTMALYPHQYAVEVHYNIHQSKTEITYIVQNLGQDVMPFSIGAHPAFNIPLNQSERRSDYILEFDNNETAPSLLLDNQGYLNGKTKSVFNQKNQIEITDNLFSEDALIFKNLNSNSLHLLNKQKEKIWTFSFNGFNYLGIWSKSSVSPFICIEPWVGVADKINARWEFKDKEGVRNIAPGQKFECSHSILIH